MNGSRPGFIKVCGLIYALQWLLNNKAPAESWESDDRAFSVVIQLCASRVGQASNGVHIFKSTEKSSYYIPEESVPFSILD